MYSDYNNFSFCMRSIQYKSEFSISLWVHAYSGKDHIHFQLPRRAVGHIAHQISVFYEPMETIIFSTASAGLLNTLIPLCLCYASARHHLAQ